MAEGKIQSPFAVSQETVTGVSGITYIEKNVYRNNSVVRLSIKIDSTNNTASCSAWGSLTIGSIPSGYRPKTDILKPTQIADKSTGKWITVNIQITASGNIYLLDHMEGSGFTLRTAYINEFWIA